MVVEVSYLRHGDVDRGISALRHWRDRQPSKPKVILTPGLDPDAVPLPAPLLPVSVETSRGAVRASGSLVLWSPDEAGLDLADFQLPGARQALIVLGDDATPTMLGWLRRWRAAHLLDNSVLTPLNGVLAEPAVEFGLRYLLSTPVRGLHVDAFRTEPARAKAVSAFQAFRAAGIPVEPGALLIEFLVSNGATVSDAHALVECARAVGDNTDVPALGHSGLPEDILTRWRAAVSPQRPQSPGSKDGKYSR